MTTLKGIFPDTKLSSRKNFIQENVKNLRRMEQYFHSSNKQTDDLEKLRISKQQNKYQNILPKINSRMQADDLDYNSMSDKSDRRKSNVEQKPKIQTNNVIDNDKIKKQDRRLQNLKKNTHINMKVLPTPQAQHYCNDFLNNDDDDDNNNKTFRNQGMQTIGDGDLVQLYAEGTIRYPSGRGPRKSPLKINSKELTTADESCKHNINKLNSSNEKEDEDEDEEISKALKHHIINSPTITRQELQHIKINKGKTLLATKIAAQLNNGTVPPSYRKGVVPKYIKERKEEKLQLEIKAQADAELIADCPDGHVPLPDNERKETLKKLKKNYQDFVNKLNMIPIRSDTLRSQRQKIEIERELNKLEEGIKVFSRPKVFIKINE